MPELFDPKLPKGLRELQEWFASIISHPLVKGEVLDTGLRDQIGQYVPNGPVQKGYQRFEVYCQQYWWGLFRVLEVNNPLLVNLFSQEFFRENIATPFLQMHPSNHWAIDMVGQRLPQWLRLHYQGNNKEMVCEAAAIDEAFTTSFFVRESPAITPQELVSMGGVEGLMDQPLYLQPFVRLFKLTYPLFELREEMMDEKEVDWNLKAGKPTHYILGRNQEKRIVWKKSLPAESFLLSQFAKGSSLSDACSQLGNLGKDMILEAEEHLSDWLHHWISLKWLTPVKPSAHTRSV